MYRTSKLWPVQSNFLFSDARSFILFLSIRFILSFYFIFHFPNFPIHSFFLSLFLRVSIKHLPIVGQYSLYSGLKAIRSFRGPTLVHRRTLPSCALGVASLARGRRRRRGWLWCCLLLVANLKVDLWLAVTKAFRLSNALRYFHYRDRAFVSGLG